MKKFLDIAQQAFDQRTSKYDEQAGMLTLSAFKNLIVADIFWSVLKASTPSSSHPEKKKKIIAYL